MKYPTRFQQKTLWSAATGLGILTLGSLLVALVWLIGQIFGFLQPVLVPLVVAGIIAYLLDPIVRILEKRGLSRLWSVIVVFFGILIAITLLVIAVLPGIRQGKDFFKEKVTASQVELNKSQKPTGLESSGLENQKSQMEARLNEMGQALVRAKSMYEEAEKAGDTKQMDLVIENGRIVADSFRELENKFLDIEKQIADENKNQKISSQQTSEKANTAESILEPIIGTQENTDLASALALSLHNMRVAYKDNPIGWALTEVTDDGEPIAYANDAPSPDSLEFFWRTRAGRTLFEYKSELLGTGKKWLSIGSSKFLGFLGLILGMIMVPIYLFFFLKDSVSIREHWHDYVPLRASRFKTELVSTLQEINGYLISFFRGQVLVGIIDGILVGIALFIFDLPYALLIGVFMGILGIIPYIGNILCLIPACIIAYLHAQTVETPFNLEPWPYVGCVVLIFAGVQQINSIFTAPKIVGDSVGLHPLTVIFSMLFWSLILGGFVGALLAVPLSAAVKVIFQRYFWEKRMHEQKTSEYFR